MKIIDIFPTPLGYYELGRQFSETELSFIDKQNWEEHLGNYGSTATNLLDAEEFTDLRLFVEKSLNDYLTKTISPVDDNEFYITQSWANVTQPGQHHHPHKHQNSLISGVLYISAEDGKDGILFSNEKYNRIELAHKETTEYNSAKFVYVKTGDLLLFPSETEHLVQQTISNFNRISVAFNTFVKGDLGHKHLYCGLNL